MTVTFEEGFLLNQEIQDRLWRERHPVKTVDGDDPYDIDYFKEEDDQ